MLDFGFGSLEDLLLLGETSGEIGAEVDKKIQ
jgi:hypothetical protein